MFTNNNDNDNSLSEKDSLQRSWPVQQYKPTKKSKFNKNYKSISTDKNR